MSPLSECVRDAAAPVVVVGIPVVDMVGHVESYPDLGGHSPGIALSYAPGGPAANVATGVARLGHRSTLLGKIGTDHFGELLKSALGGEGVEIPASFVVHNAPTGVVLVLYDQYGLGEMRSFSFRRGSADTMLRDDDIALHYIEGARALFVDGILVVDEQLTRAGERAGRLAREAGIRVFLDPNLRVPGDAVPDDMADRMARLMSAADEILLNEREARMLSRGSSIEDAACRLSERHGNVDCWVIKRGEDGCIVIDGGRSFARPAFTVKVSDTSGAGDSFDAAWIVSCLEGRERRETARFASAAAAITVSGTGAWKSLPTREQVRRFLEEHGDGIGG